MGCGKSKPADVATGNTTFLQRKKSSVGQENGAETNGKINNNNNNNVENVGSEVEQKKNENVVKENGDAVIGKADEPNNEEKNVQEEKALEKKEEADGAEGNTKEIVVEGGEKKDDSLKENDKEVGDAPVAAEEKQPAEEKEAQENEQGVQRIMSS